MVGASALEALALACTRCTDLQLICKALCVSKSTQDAVLKYGARSLAVDLTTDDGHRLEQQALWLSKATYRLLVRKLVLEYDRPSHGLAASTLHLAVTAVQPTELELRNGGRARPPQYSRILHCIQPNTLVSLECDWLQLATATADIVAHVEQLVVRYPELDAAVPLFNSMQRLRMLDLVDAVGSGDALLLLNHATQLQCVILRYTEFDEPEQRQAAQQHAAAWPALQQLQQLLLDDMGWDVEGALARGVASTTQLTSLHLWNFLTPAGDPHIALRNMIEPLQQLEHLVLLSGIYAPYVTAELPALGHLSRGLQYLQIKSHSLSISAVVDVCAAAQLQHLRLKCTVTAGQLAALTDHLTNLQTQGLKAWDDGITWPKADEWVAVLQRPVWPRLRQVLLLSNDPECAALAQAMQGMQPGLTIKVAARCWVMSSFGW